MGALSAIYRILLLGRRFLFKKGIKRTKKLPAKVISVGNLTLGGTGKTPAVIAIAQEAKKRGFKPCVLTRGYKGRAKEPCLVQSSEVRSQKSEDKKLRRWEGDEPVLMAERLKDVSVVKCTDRYKGGLFALNSSLVTRHSSPLFILDDGFQHWGLHRDIDILLVDATNPFGNEKLFPEGILREPLNSMKRADIIVITKADAVDNEVITAIKQKIKQYNLEAPVYTASHKPIAFISASGAIKSLESLNNKRIYAFAGIANPSYFIALLESQGIDVIKFKKFRDHYNYTQRDINKIKKEAGNLAVVTTEKDLVKLKELELPENIFALRIEFSIDESFYDILLNLK